MKSVGLAGTCTAALLALVLTGCGQDDALTTSAPTGSPRPSAAARAGLPDGIEPVGSQQQLAGGAWTASVRSLKAAPAPADGSVPTGWSAARVQVALTNTGTDIALLPETRVTVRVGEHGLQTAPFTAKTLPGFPEPDAGTEVKPEATFTADLGVALPPQGAGQQATVTLEATQAGLADAEAVFFEGKTPGSPGGTAPAPSATAASGSAVKLGQWSPDGVQVSPLQLAADQGGRRKATLELSVRNTDGEPRSGMGVTLRVLVGAGLTTADTVSAGLGYQDAPIAPHRTATATVRVSVPSHAVPGPVTVEAEQRGGERLMFQGTLK
ncbi:hypothetical protein SMD44_p10198 (plasmid) [Streptomyces alboflavus]|uniref:Lipoprotein n=1 Tax=Streptomyces alboflavus TaxID=67267 RepID=A0A291W455_9ACTN|nr:hypothetical protein [Streptomyces alboflavus]ATM24697.1 hypothetical protein SMD44_p10198 [Streptomyces alboflavus]